ncbi:NAD(P)H-binding protein [Chitinophaga pinensis]|uniref:NAD(P)-binding domain-containing protein n=1 Tax=Chitinophaga pinensis (strain ATCC 43595 / DSM 2588 / LMG 13176 / NBRC 15968 / NCIMB 11800 / UQM 2034) TaxID=485918 RepID=A0A979GQG4_CHIPD|nr:NAD(P)H-binding protein [Chitinophaga pinensis]ACU60003.1 hypothetical protein Cpin_2519 [Chitinophaga pinensis DSM 2588]
MENRVLIFGATGRTGLIATAYAIQQGYHVTVLVRNPEKITIQSDKLRIIKGSPANIEEVRMAMKNCRYVINLLSALSQEESFSFKKIDAPHVLEKSIKNAILCMREYGIKRILSLSSIGVGDSYKYAPWFMRLIIKITNFSIVFADHNAQEQLLRESDLDWTIARPVALNNDQASGTLVVNYNKRPRPFKMSRKQLAAFFINNLNTSDYIHKSPVLSESAAGS